MGQWLNFEELLLRNGYVVSKMLSHAVNRAKAQNLYGRLEPGQLLQHETLANTLEKIATIPEKGRKDSVIVIVKVFSLQV